MEYFNSIFAVFLSVKYDHKILFFILILYINHSSRFVFIFVLVRKHTIVISMNKH